MGDYDYQSNISGNRIVRPGEIPNQNPYGGSPNTNDIYGAMHGSQVADMDAYDEMANTQIANAELQANRDAALAALSQMQTNKKSGQQLENAFRNQVVGAVNPILSGILG